MGKRLSDGEVREFAERGFLAPIRVMDAAEALTYRSRLEGYEQRAGRKLESNLRHKVNLLFPWCDELIRHPRILDCVEDIIGPDILCWNVHLFAKDPDHASYVSWHQDSAYWGLEPSDVVTAWVALSEASRESGCMEVIPGTHLADSLPHVDTFAKDNLLSRGQEVAVKVDESKAVELALHPGEMSLHHIKLVHGSRPNHSNDRRIGVAIRYMPTHVRQVRFRDSAMLVRGRDAHGHFDPEPRPHADMDAAAVAAHKDAVERVLSGLMAGTDKKEFRA
jgi:ectoine hydroxylase-related dioxygenase (phytanoyl-CoA dioxygenase family)